MDEEESPQGTRQEKLYECFKALDKDGSGWAAFMLGSLHMEPALLTIFRLRSADM